MMKVLRGVASASKLGRSFGMKPGEDISELDAANLRKFMRETSMIITLSAAMVVVGAMGGGDDPDKTWYRTYVLNQMVRLKRDLLTYMDPASLASILKNPAPVLSTVTDFTKLIISMMQTGILMDPYMGTGAHQQLRVVNELKKNVPFLTQYDKMSNKLTKTLSYTSQY